MQYWIRISFFICLFGFLKEIRPSDPHTFYDFLVTKGMTLSEVNQDIVPVRIYSTLCTIVVVFLTTDLCRYKPIIIILGLAMVTAAFLFILGKTLKHFQIAAFMLGLSDAAEVAYFTYIYAKVEKKFYRNVTSFVVAAVLGGKFICGLLSQILISTKSMNFLQLHYVTAAAVIMAAVWSFFIPAVEKSAYFCQDDTGEGKKCKPYKRCCGALELMKKHMTTCFSNKYILKWLVWLSVSSGCFLIVCNYVQLLWGEVSKSEGNRYPYNGAAGAIFTLTCFLTALIAGVLKVDWVYKVELTLTVGSLLLGFVTIVASQASTVMVCFGCYIAYGGLFYFLSVVATSEIVKYIEGDSYGLVIGVVTFISLCIEAILTAVIASELELKPRQQYILYGLYHIIIAIVYIIVGLTNWLRAAELAYSRAF